MSRVDTLIAVSLIVFFGGAVVALAWFTPIDPDDPNPGSLR